MRMPALLGEKGKPKIKPSRLKPDLKAQSQQENSDQASKEKKPKKKRPGSEKRRLHCLERLFTRHKSSSRPNQFLPTQNLRATKITQFKG
ncbi:MAG: hypothetical protein F6K47_23680 [Symploca sp. SIO2E6]|nr:hypothetical protein [Symploca sp. SIO2E6]